MKTYIEGYKRKPKECAECRNIGGVYWCNWAYKFLCLDCYYDICKSGKARRGEEFDEST